MGNQFRFYGTRGTDDPEDYPPGFRQLMSAIPFWSDRPIAATNQRRTG